jgi:hypothetical protein
MGTATVQLRHYPSERTAENFRVRMLERGYNVSPQKQRTGKQRNYTSTTGRMNKTFDAYHQMAERRLGGAQVTAKEAKMKMLETSTDGLFGSSAGVGRWSAAWKREG